MGEGWRVDSSGGRGSCGVTACRGDTYIHIYIYEEYCVERLGDPQRQWAWGFRLYEAIP